MIAYLQSLGGTPTVTLQTTHRYYTARPHRAGRRPRLLRPRAQPGLDNPPKGAQPDLTFRRRPR